MKYLKLEDLEAWVEAKKLCIGIYTITKKYPPEERYITTKHLRESGRGVMGNIAEGFGRFFYKESIQFYNIAKGCLFEIRSDLNLSCELLYINKEVYERFIWQIDKVHAKINGLIYHTKDQLEKNNNK